MTRELILKVCREMRELYLQFAQPKKHTVTDKLLTKVLLGTMGCFPALDNYFRKGCEDSEFSVPGDSWPWEGRWEKRNPIFIRDMLHFCRKHVREFQDERTKIREYQSPLMKLVDAYFHQIGLEVEEEEEKKKKEEEKKKA